MADYGASLSIVDMALAASKRQRQQDADWMAIQVKLDDDWLAEFLPLSKFAKTMHQSSCPVVHLDDLNQLGEATAHMSEAPTIPACLEYTSVDTLLQAPTSAEPVLAAATSTPEAELSCDDAMHMSNLCLVTVMRPCSYLKPSMPLMSGGGTRHQLPLPLLMHLTVSYTHLTLPTIYSV